jgi:hypothetical protein
LRTLSNRCGYASDRARAHITDGKNPALTGLKRIPAFIAISGVNFAKATHALDIRRLQNWKHLVAA